MDSNRFHSVGSPTVREGSELAGDRHWPAPASTRKKLRQPASTCVNAHQGVKLSISAVYSANRNAIHGISTAATPTITTIFGTNVRA